MYRTFGLNKKSIRKRVMAVIEKKIEEAQKDHDEAAKKLDDELEASIKALNDKVEVDREALLEAHVTKILGKIM